MKPEAEPSLKTVFAKIGNPAATTFRPDPFQLDALEAIREEDCLVMAPTGSGKTWIAEEAIRSDFLNGGRCWYASPLETLPKTRSGKILRATIRKIADGEDYEIPSTIEDTSVLTGITASAKSIGCARKAS